MAFTSLSDLFKLEPGGYQWLQSGPTSSPSDDFWRNIGQPRHGESQSYINAAMADPRLFDYLVDYYSFPNDLSQTQKALQSDPYFWFDSAGQALTRWGGDPFGDYIQSPQLLGSAIQRPDLSADLTPQQIASGQHFNATESAEAQAARDDDDGLGGLLGLAALAAGAYFGLPALAGTSGVSAAGAAIPELGLIATPATASAAISAGIPASMLSGGAGALSLADIAGGGLAESGNFGPLSNWNNVVGDIPISDPNYLDAINYDFGPAPSFDPSTLNTNFPDSWWEGALSETASNPGNYAPVTDLSRVYNPATAGGLPNLGNLIASSTGSGSLGDLLGGSGGIIQQVLGGQTGMGQQGQTGGYSFPWGNVIGALLEYMNQGDVLKAQKELMQQAIDSDLWRPQQPRYFEPLYDAVTKGIGNTAYGQSIAEATDRFGASKGYGSSSNMLQEIARGLNQGTNQYVSAIAPLAMGRGGQGSTMAQFAPGITGAMQGQSGALGAGLQSIISGSQPTYAQQQRGTPRNQTLSELIASL